MRRRAENVDATPAVPWVRYACRWPVLVCNWTDVWSDSSRQFLPSQRQDRLLEVFSNLFGIHQRRSVYKKTIKFYCNYYSTLLSLPHILACAVKCLLRASFAQRTANRPSRCCGPVLLEKESVAQTDRSSMLCPVAQQIHHLNKCICYKQGHKKMIHIRRHGKINNQKIIHEKHIVNLQKSLTVLQKLSHFLSTLKVYLFQ